MLAVAVEDMATIKFPVLATPKLDGIRCVVVGGKALSRKFKPIPNHFIRNWIEANCPDGFDGEIMAGETFNECQSLVMSEDGEPDFRYMVFDYVMEGLDRPYNLRIADLKLVMRQSKPSRVTALCPILINNQAELDDYEARCLEDEYEGVMLRDPAGAYKCGRSTLKQGWLLKLKRFADSEAVIVGFNEQMHNNNPAEKGELGQTKRSTHKANLVSTDMVGSVQVRDIHHGWEFALPGFDNDLKKAMKQNPKLFLNKIACYRYQPAGMKDLPRFPSFKGFRHEDDI